MHIRWLLGTALIGSTLCVQAQTPPDYQGWTLFTSTDTAIFYFKNNSARLENGKRSLLIQQVPTEKSTETQIDFKKLTVSEQDCKNGYGSVMLYTPSGTLRSTVDYVKDGISVASGLADLLCAVNFTK